MRDRELSMILPSEEYLRELYDHLHWRYFNNEFSEYDVQIQWSKMLTVSAGNCTSYREAKKAIIKVSVWYYMQYPEDLEQVLLHEMIHIKIDGHGKAFREEMQRIRALGGDVRRYSKGVAKKRKWKYECQRCGRNFSRLRRLNIKAYSCICGGQLTEREMSNE